MASSSLNVPDASLTNPDGFPPSGATATNIGSLTKELKDQSVVFAGRIITHIGSEFAVKDVEGHIVICRADFLEPGFVEKFLMGWPCVIIGIVIPVDHFDGIDLQKVKIRVTKIYYPSTYLKKKIYSYYLSCEAAAANSEVDGSTGKALQAPEEPGFLVTTNQINRPKVDCFPMDMSMDSGVLANRAQVINEHFSRDCFLNVNLTGLRASADPIHIEETIFEESARLYPASWHEGDHITVQYIDDDFVQDQPDVVQISLISKVFNFMKPNIERVKIISKGLDVLEVLGSEKLTKSALNLTAQMTGCLTASYFANSNGQLPKSLLYSAAAANTVGFLGSCGGIAIRDKEPRAASIIGGIGTVFAAATFMMVMGTFIPNN